MRYSAVTGPEGSSLISSGPSFIIENPRFGSSIWLLAKPRSARTRSARRPFSFSSLGIRTKEQCNGTTDALVAAATLFVANSKFSLSRSPRTTVADSGRSRARASAWPPLPAVQSTTTEGESIFRAAVVSSRRTGICPVVLGDRSTVLMDP